MSFFFNLQIICRSENILNNWTRPFIHNDLLSDKIAQQLLRICLIKVLCLHEFHLSAQKWQKFSSETNVEQGLIEYQRKMAETRSFIKVFGEKNLMEKLSLLIKRLSFISIYLNYGFRKAEKQLEISF